MRGVSAFPPGFGEDMALMFAGSAAPAAERVAPGSADALPPDAVPADQPVPDARSFDHRPPSPATDQALGEATGYAAADTGPDGAPAGWKQTIRLDERGFYLGSAAGDADLDDEATAEAREPINILIPTAIVGVILVASTYYLGIPI